MSNQLNWLDTHNVIFSQGSASGPTRSDAPGGQTTGRSGPDPAHANLSARQAKEMGLMTSGIYGPPSTGSLDNVAASELGRSGTSINRSVRLASGRFAVLQKGKQFALVPWQQAMRMRKGMGIGMGAERGMGR